MSGDAGQNLAVQSKPAQSINMAPEAQIFAGKWSFYDIMPSGRDFKVSGRQ